MKKNIIVVISILLVLVCVILAIVIINTPDNKPVVNNKPVYVDAVTDVNNDLQAIDFGSLDKEFDKVNKDIESL